ncbi:Dynein light chain [Teratosphaeriaceae sp. CCFEE 6253]|nr:Dynein light chain [Teratosphaeriaceae sp. CCFEE 6253]
MADVKDGEKAEKLEVQIKSVDMSEDMQQEAIEIGTASPGIPTTTMVCTDDACTAQEAMDKFNIEKVRFVAFEHEFESLRHLQEIAHHIKRTVGLRSLERQIQGTDTKQFDERKGATWHCIVGRNFGSFVTHETKHFIYFYLGHCAILLFKTQ